MDKLEREKYKKKMKFHEKLGALKFQKVVFGVERIKFKVLKTLCPNFIKYFDKYCDFKKKRAIDKTTSEEEIIRIEETCIFNKMAMRKEFNQEKNRNYHIDSKRPTEIYKYLKWNRSVHETGLIKDGILIPVLIIGSIAQVPGALPILIYELISAGINFECINIQDYNICRYKLSEDILKKREERNINKSIEEYRDAASVIHKTITKKADVPSIEEVVDNIENVSQLEQLRRLIEEEKKKREYATTVAYTEKPKQKIRGNE